MQKAFADFFKPELPKKIRTCAVDNFVTSKLFGDDLGKQIKESTDVCRVNRKIVLSNGAEKTIRNICHMINRNLMTEEFWTTKYEVDFYTKALHCNRQRYSVLRIIYALFIRKMEENNTLGLFKTLEVLNLKFCRMVCNKRLWCQEIYPFQVKKKTHEQKEVDRCLIMDIVIIQYLSYDLSCGYILNIFTWPKKGLFRV